MTRPRNGDLQKRSGFINHRPLDNDREDEGEDYLIEELGSSVGGESVIHPSSDEIWQQRISQFNKA